MTDADGPYAQLFELSPFPAVVSRLDDSRVLAINARTAEMLGVPPGEAAGVPVTDYYVDPDERRLVVERLHRDGQVENVRLQIRRRSGEPLWVTAWFRVITWEGEVAVLSVFYDISAQVSAETTLGASEHRLVAQSDALTALTARYTNPSETFDERLRSILEISARALRVGRLSMWQFDEDRSHIRCFGLYRQSVNLFEAGAVLDRDQAPAYFEALESERVIAASDARTDVRTREFLDSYLIPNAVCAMLDVPLRHDNRTVGVLCAEHLEHQRVWTVDEQNFSIAAANLIVVALSEEDRRHALMRLAESEARARLIVDSAHDAFIGIDSNDVIVAWNAQAEKTFGWTREEAIGRRLVATVVPPAFRDAHINGMRRFHATGEAPVVNQRLELTALHRSGHEFPVELTISSPMPAGSGFFFGGFLRDISERRERDAELRRAKDAAESATRAKSEFLANMSHELRTPLNGVLGYAQLLQRDRGLAGAQRDALDAISRCGSQLLDLINDVLDLSKIEAGRLDLEESTIDLVRLVTDIQYVVAESAERKGLHLTVAIDDQVPRLLVIDGRHLRQVLLNLVGNAIKFTAAGDVRLTVTREGTDRLSFAVVDTGIGIEPESMTEIFAAFAQTRAGAAAGGTGLGLAICHRLISRMGGELRVESALGEGSRFHFTLPLVSSSVAVAADAERDAAPPLDARLAPGEELSALVVDDSSANRHILASLLESAGVRVFTAAGGFAAIELARTHRPDVIFMDLKMNDLDGLEATRRLARDPVTATIPVIAVTASAFGEIRQTARDAGCVDYLSKPIRAQLLFGMLQTHLGVQLVGGDTGETPAETPVDDTRHAAVAIRLRQAVALGDIGDIQALAADLMLGTPAERAIGDRMNRLLMKFDFTALGELADSLVA